jgi:hypothetical protein
MQQNRKLRSLNRRRFTMGFGALEFPINCSGDGNERHRGEEDDERRAEPVEFLALVENDLQRSEANGDEAESRPVDRELACPLFGLFHVRRVFEDDAGKEDTEDAYGDVDVKDPARVSGNSRFLCQGSA